MADWELTYNGLTVGGSTAYKLAELSGFQDAPDVRSSDMDRARTHGQFAGVDLLGGRSIQAEFTIEATGNDDWSAFSAAMVAGQADELALTAQLPGVAGGVPVIVWARVRRLNLPIDKVYRVANVGRAVVEWWCTDPLIYDANETQLSTGLATVAASGFTFDATFPLDFGGAVDGGLVAATNDGEFPAPWVAEIVGPVTNPRIENVTTGQTVSFTTTLALGDTLTVDSRERTVLFNGANRYQWLTAGSQWFDLAPGANSVRFAGTSGTGSMQLTYRSAWV